MLEPFQKMLQFALQPLLLYVDPIADQPGDVLLLKLNASLLSVCNTGVIAKHCSVQSCMPAE